MKRDTKFLTHSLIAHRGDHNIKLGIPENSLLAFEEAIKNNYIIELDVHVLKDGNVVVFHDDNLKRVTGLSGKIKDMSYNDIKDLRLQKTYQKIPLLSEVLELVDGKVPIIIELKYDVKCGVLEKEVIKLLKQYSGKYAVKSFSPLSMYYFRMHFKEAIRGQLSSGFEHKKLSKVKKYLYSKMCFNFLSKPDFISYDIASLPSKRVERLRKKRIILGWTIKSKEDMEKAQKYCDNFICEMFNLK